MGKIKEFVWHKKRQQMVSNKVLKPHAELDTSKNSAPKKSNISPEMKKFFEKLSEQIRNAAK
ncbi:MAG: hypothetical protein HQL25_04800 [Candidatus Omnitrophica bacterium]|nr:hypothetical protein [Candidatus Omnitrophota bacterium]